MSIKNYNNDIIWIIGASSGIGEALAYELSDRGAIIALSARRKENLSKIAKKLTGTNACFPLDVEKDESIEKAAKQIKDKFGRIDRIIFLAAEYKPMSFNKLDIKSVKKTININLLGAFKLIYTALPVIEKQNRCQIVLCGSIAGYFGLPKGQPYSATKAGIVNLAESLNAELPKKFDVKLISPGFVKTDLTDKNQFEMPGIISTKKAAIYIANGLRRNNFEVCFPWKIVLALKFLRLLPYWISSPLSRLINK